MHWPKVVGASVTTLVRGGLGLSVGALGERPERPLELYEFEGCPFCRRVREALSVLDLEAMVHPCPKGGRRFRDELDRIGGRLQFPYLLDPNASVAMYESSDIVDYLFARYGAGPPPAGLRRGLLATAGVMLSGVGRGPAGSFARPSRAPAEPLELYSFEASPFCRLVRERLCELELPYWLHNVAKGSPRREAFVARSGRMQVPYLVDPNEGVEMFESAEIIDYLTQTYARARD
jgi:glutathione S-transferase